MNIVDIVIIAILALSVLVGLWRGLISEVLALVTWIAAFWVAWLFGPAVAAHFSRWIESPLVRLVVGYGLCFIAVLIVGALVRFGITRLVDGTGLGGTDRLLGMIFGFARGLLLVTLIVFLAGLTPFVRDPMWRQSMLLPQFQGMATWLEQQLPANVREHLHPSTLDNLKAHLQDVPERIKEAAHAVTTPAAASTAPNATH